MSGAKIQQGAKTMTQETFNVMYEKGEEVYHNESKASDKTIPELLHQFAQSLTY